MPGRASPWQRRSPLRSSYSWRLEERRGRTSRPSQRAPRVTHRRRRAKNENLAHHLRCLGSAHHVFWISRAKPGSDRGNESGLDPRLDYFCAPVLVPARSCRVRVQLFEERINAKAIMEQASPRVVDGHAPVSAIYFGLRGVDGPWCGLCPAWHGREGSHDVSFSCRYACRTFCRRAIGLRRLSKEDRVQPAARADALRAWLILNVRQRNL